MQWPDFSDDVSLQRDVLMAVAERFAKHPAVRDLRLIGSLAAGTADRHSDVDLLVRVDPGCLGTLWGARVALVASRVPSVLDLDHQWGGPGLSYAVLYENGVYLDLTLTDQEASGGQGAPSRPLWHRVGPPCPPEGTPGWLPAVAQHPLDDTVRMFWLGALLCAKYIARRDLWAACWFLESRRAQWVRAWRLVHCPGRAEWGWSKVEEDLPPVVLDRLASTVTPMNQRRFAEALCVLMQVMDDYGPGLSAAGGTVYPAHGALVVRQLVDGVFASL